MSGAGAFAVRLAALLPALVCAACFSAMPGLSTVDASGSRDDAADRSEPETSEPGEVLGEFEVTDSGLARGQIRPTRCDSGDLSQFLGGDLTDETLDVTVRLVIDPLYGPALRVYDEKEPYERSVLFFEEECDQFDMTFEPTGWVVNDVIVRQLELTVDCMNEDGATLTGHATAECN